MEQSVEGTKEKKIGYGNSFLQCENAVYEREKRREVLTKIVTNLKEMVSLFSPLQQDFKLFYL